MRLNSASRRWRSVSGDTWALGLSCEDEDDGCESVIGSRISTLGFFSNRLMRRRRSFSTMRADIFSFPRSSTRERMEPITRPRMMIPPIAKGKRRPLPRWVVGL